MSGGPNRAGIENVLSLLQSIEAVTAEVVTFEETVRNLNDARKRLGDLRQQLREMLLSMDLMQTGNFGHPERLEAFVAEMRRQLEARR